MRKSDFNYAKDYATIQEPRRLLNSIWLLIKYWVLRRNSMHYIGINGSGVEIKIRRKDTLEILNKLYINSCSANDYMVNKVAIRELLTELEQPKHMEWWGGKEPYATVHEYTGIKARISRCDILGR